MDTTATNNIERHLGDHDSQKSWVDSPGGDITPARCPSPPEWAINLAELEALMGVEPSETLSRSRLGPAVASMPPTPWLAIDQETDQPENHKQYRDRRPELSSAHYGRPPAVAAIEPLLRAATVRIQHTYHSYCLTTDELRSIQRSVQRLHQSGVDCDPEKFWSATTKPRSELFVSSVTSVVEAELRPLFDQSRTWLGSGELTSRLPPSELIEALVSVVPSRVSLDRTGRWWLRKLRRAAVARCWPELARSTPAQASAVIDRSEITLLAQAPWYHGDQLLSTFEAAHRQIMAYTHALAVTALA